MMTSAKIIELNNKINETHKKEDITLLLEAIMACPLFYLNGVEQESGLALNIVGEEGALAVLLALDENYTKNSAMCDNFTGDDSASDWLPVTATQIHEIMLSTELNVVLLGEQSHVNDPDSFTIVFNEMARMLFSLNITDASERSLSEIKVSMVESKTFKQRLYDFCLTIVSKFKACTFFVLDFGFNSMFVVIYDRQALVTYQKTQELIQAFCNEHLPHGCTLTVSDRYDHIPNIPDIDEGLTEMAEGIKPFFKAADKQNALAKFWRFLTRKTRYIALNFKE